MRSLWSVRQNVQEGKVCSKCRVWKPYSEYWRGKDTKEGYKSACKECSKKYKKKYVEFECARCHQRFKRRKDLLKEINYCYACSKKIVGEKNKGKVLEKLRKGEYVSCDNCGKMHYKKRSHLKRGHKHHFCSKKCQGEWSAKHKVADTFILSANNKDKNNGRYKHGNRVGYHQRHKKLKEQIFKRDGKGCLLCKSLEELHVHRIIPGALGGKYELDNTVVLCKVHHQIVHNNYDFWKNELIKRITRNREVS